MVRSLLAVASLISALFVGTAAAHASIARPGPVLVSCTVGSTCTVTTYPSPRWHRTVYVQHEPLHHYGFELPA